MFTFNKTAIVYNDPNKIVGLPPYYYRLRSCDTNLNGNTPADQYQKLKLIQKTVRVPASLYTANLGPLTAYKKPLPATITNTDTTNGYGNVWQPIGIAENYVKVSMSSSGQYQTATVGGGQIYVSTDYGNNWSPKNSNRAWGGISVSSSGQYQTATVYNGQIYVSTDFGNTWIAKAFNYPWVIVSISSSGQYQTASAYIGFIYISTDFGNTWIGPKASSQAWNGLSISSSGQYQTASVENGQIYVSTDFGNIWTAKDSVRQWAGVSLSSSGQYQTALVNGGQIYISSDFGNNWSPKDSNRGWREVSLSSSGQYQTAIVNVGNIYVSNDFGNTWNPKASSQAWIGITVSSSGLYQTAVVQGGRIYTSTPIISTYNTGFYGVCWNQMSDRPVPSVQRVTVPTGSNNSMNSRRHSVTSSKPGSQTPGGKGCDIKHNSYDRYLNRLKGKGPLRRGVVPPTFGAPIPFNPAFPIYGGKTMKTSIIDGCDCPIDGNQVTQDERIYNDPLYQPVPEVPYGFDVGSYVYAMQNGNNFYTRAIVTAISGDDYTIQFDNGTIQTTNLYELKIYFPCNCGTTINGVTYSSGEFITIGLQDQVQCTFPVSLLT